MIRKQDTDQLVAAPQIPIQFANNDIAASVMGPIRERHDNAASFAQAEWEQADKAQADADSELTVIADLKHEIIQKQAEVSRRSQTADQRSRDRDQHEARASQAVEVALGNAVVLAAGGIVVPGIARPPRLMPMVETGTFMAFQDQGSFPETIEDGACLNCHQPAWRRAVSEASPNGATHSFGASCYPNQENSPVADLGPVSES